ncbi:Transposon Ty3-I Gag-Pol polyprotein [Labeo rohita]|uniref:ribonuclease H n=1 Tax=Labeo rohita TaxID=84645 RepID=A0ABQ8L603_LABRO|nr:Transposon Ty3-I Gag-Pol polyprotein [Labeo rohita]
MKHEVTYLLENGFAVPSSSPWSSPCVLVPKADGSFRFCTDFRKVNSVTVPDAFPLPRIDDCIDSLGTAKYITKLDLLKGYWQVPLTERASEISAFVTPDSFLQYTRMAFGLRNAPATFQRLMSLVLGDVPNCNIYLDDVVIFSSTWDEHLLSLYEVFRRLSAASLTLNLKKCEFAKASVTYLGKQVGNGQVRPLDAKIAAVLEYPIPTTRRELRRFLGMVGYYRCFCKNFSSVVAPLTRLCIQKLILIGLMTGTRHFCLPNLFFVVLLFSLLQRYPVRFSWRLMLVPLEGELSFYRRVLTGYSILFLISLLSLTVTSSTIRPLRKKRYRFYWH